MHFTGNIWRPPYEAGSALIQVTSGCMHGKCRFCSLYDTPFRLSPREEVESDLKELAAFMPRARRVFITGANPFGVANSKLVPLLRLIRKRMPSVQSVGGFIRIADIRRKSDEDLRELAEAGASMLTIGVETGYDPALAFMEKGHTAADIVEQCLRLDAAGISYAFFYLTGIAGAGKGLEAARASAQIFNQVSPVLVGILSMTLFPESRLYADVEAGHFTPAGEVECLEEIRELVAGLEGPVDVSTAHVSDAVHVAGRLPRDRKRLLSALDSAIAHADELQLRRRRNSIRTL